MMKRIFAVLVFGAVLAACTTQSPVDRADGKIRVTILHFNDIYEITPVSG